jgi:SPX domain protein involved in polyphosphate accumulation
MPNAAGQEGQSTAPTGPLKCGDVGTYAELKKRKTNKQERDHVPAFSSMLEKATAGKDLTPTQATCIANKLKAQALTIAIPKGVHVKHSRTCKGRGGKKRIKKDAKNLDKAAEDDIAALENKVPPACREAYKKAAEQVKAQDHKALIRKVTNECTP